MNKRIENLKALRERINDQIESFMYGNQDLGDMLYSIGEACECLGYDIKNQRDDNDRAWENEISQEEKEIIKSIYTGDEL